MIDQDKIHNQCLSENPEELVKVLKRLEEIFPLIPNKDQAWNDIVRLFYYKGPVWARAVSYIFAPVLSSDFEGELGTEIEKKSGANVIFYAAYTLRYAFPHMLNKQQAWNDLHQLANDQNRDVRCKATEVIGDVFSYIPDKQQAWNDLHRLTNDKNHHVRVAAVEALGSAFFYLPDKNKRNAYNDLYRLANDQNSDVRVAAVKALGSVFSQVQDKYQVWNDLYESANDQNRDVRIATIETLGSSFSQVPDKQQAWDDLHKLINDIDSHVRYEIASAIGSAFFHIPNKKQAWEDLHRLTSDEDNWVKSNAVESLGSAFSQIPDKQQAWEDLHRLTNEENLNVRSSAVKALGFAYFYLPDKQQAWISLINLFDDEDSNLKGDPTEFLGSLKEDATEVLGYILSKVSDKQQAWSYLHKLTNDTDSSVRLKAIEALSFAFPHIPDKQHAWNDLHLRSNDHDVYMRSKVAKSIGSVFSVLPDKQQAFDDLHKLTSDKETIVRYNASEALGSLFSQVPDKQQAWNDLHRLTNDKSNDVKFYTAASLGFAFPHLPDKQQAENDLYRLTTNESRNVRLYANYSLGKISIYKASQAEKEEDYKKELEKAIEFFEKAVQDSLFRQNSPRFCLPFYRSFHAIVFEKQEAKEEVGKYLQEAKNAVKGSKSKELLFEAVANLANALENIQNLENLDLKAKKDELNLFKEYCENAAECMKGTEETAPHATAAIRRGLPFLDRKLNKLLEDIQGKAKTACRESKGTRTEEIAFVVSEEVKKWEIGSQEKMVFYVENLIRTLELKIPRLPENEHIFEMIKASKDQKDIGKLFENASELIENIPEITIDQERMKPTMGIITALPKEYAAVNILMENKNDKYKVPGSGAGRRYCLGEIASEDGNKQNLVLATVGMGNNIAAARASLLLEHFPNVKSIIMVGIAGGVPNPFKDKVDDHVRLGDIVVSNENGVIQYDLIKQEIKDITHRNSPRPPSASLLEAVRYLEAEEILGNRPWEKYIVQSLSQLNIDRPSDDTDILYKSDDQDETISHPKDSKRIKGQPRVFIGPIASANILQKDPNARDKLREKFKVKAIEMEASGIADATWTHEVGYLVIRGICDYCDSHKNDEWQQYAAVVAAAYTRALIESMP